MTNFKMTKPAVTSKFLRTIKSARYKTLIFLFLSCISFSTFAVNIPIPSAPSISAKAYLLQDVQSGKILVESNAGERMEPASLTKLMTAYIVFSEISNATISLEDEVLISKKAWKTTGSKMFIEVNKRVTVSDLLQGMIIQSGNDASVALAEHVAGSESTFADLMNQYALKLGMLDSHFVNSTGMPHADHFTTAKDLSLLTQALINDFPEHYPWYSTKKFTFNKITQYNRNKLLWRDKSVDGVKTGHTESAGYCLIASAKRDDMRLLSVVLGTRSKDTRTQESQKLLNYGFRFFETFRITKKNQLIQQEKIWKGATDSLPIGTAEDLYVTIQRGLRNQVLTLIKPKSRIIAPVQSGEPLGTIEFMLNDKLIAETTLVALKSIESGSFFQRMSDELMLFIE